MKAFVDLKPITNNAFACGLAAAFTLVGCGPTVEEAAERFLPAYCDKLDACASDDFAIAYPEGVSECVDAGLSGIPEDDRSAQSACDDDEIDQCINDIEAADCASITTFDLADLPASCQGC